MYLSTNKRCNRSYKLYLQIQKNFADQILGLQRLAYSLGDSTVNFILSAYLIEHGSYYINAY